MRNDKGQFIKGGTPHNKGEYIEKASYNTIHRWVQRNFKKPDACEFCGTKEAKRFEWANLNGLYLRNREDWVFLCCSCHRIFDRRNKFNVNYIGGIYG